MRLLPANENLLSTSDERNDFKVQYENHQHLISSLHPIQRQQRFFQPYTPNPVVEEVAIEVDELVDDEGVPLLTYQM